MSFRTVFALLLATLPLSLCYMWPSPKLDSLESMRFEQTGYRSPLISLGVIPCDLFINEAAGTAGVRSNAADWLRTAYHDMATHNVEDGTGGIDGSIRFKQEQARSENAGTGFANTIAFLFRKTNRHITVADGIALLAITAIENCGGPEIPFRGGRVDATEPNNAGVPEPQQDLDSHIASFARQGFTQTEMIGLVACGHTFGSVQASAFPNIVTPPAEEHVEAGATFDSTFVHFDNNVATEYISGTTKNPLVVGANDTLNSDKRIFSSDGNLTMDALANSAALFSSTCRDLFARMLNTVPAGVELSEVIQPFPVKPADVKLTYQPDGTVTLSGEVRLWNVTENSQRAVTMKWDNRDGTACADCAITLSHSASQSSSAMSGRYTALWYGNTTASLATIDPAKGFGKFWYEIQEGGAATVRKEDQGGKRFALPTDGIMISSTSCGASGATPRVHVAVRADIQPSRVFLEAQKVNIQDIADSSRTIELTPATDQGPTNKSYAIWLTTSTSDVPTLTFGIVAEVNGARIELPYTETGLPTCS